MIPNHIGECSQAARTRLHRIVLSLEAERVAAEQDVGEVLWTLNLGLDEQVEVGCVEQSK